MLATTVLAHFILAGAVVIDPHFVDAEDARWTTDNVRRRDGTRHSIHYPSLGLSAFGRPEALDLLEYQGFDSFPGSDAEMKDRASFLPFVSLEKAKRECENRSYEGFVVSEGRVYFRSQSRLLLLEHKTPNPNATLFVFKHSFGERHFDAYAGRNGATIPFIVKRPFVTFAFLTRNGIKNSPVWTEYFEGCTHTFKLFEHNNTRDGTGKDLRFSWDMVRIMAGTVIDNLNSTWIQFLSDACVPVTSCSTYMQFLRQRSDSFIHIGGKSLYGSQWITLRTDQIRNDVPRFRDFIGEYNDGHNWQHGKIEYERRGRKRTRYEHALDEIAFPTYWKENKLPHQDRTLTYANFKFAESYDGHPESFGPGTNLTAAFPRFRGKGFFFARKFTYDLEVKEWKQASNERRVRKVKRYYSNKGG